jgi:hypothetical protein
MHPVNMMVVVVWCILVLTMLHLWSLFDNYNVLRITRGGELGAELKVLVCGVFFLKKKKKKKKKNWGEEK